MKVYKPGVLKLKIREAEGLSDIDVVAENCGSGLGGISITHEGESWRGLWLCAHWLTVQQAFISHGNDEVMEDMTLMTGVEPEYKTLCRIFDAVREAFRRYEVQDKSWCRKWKKLSMNMTI